ncbi:anthranilate phosphoribosyltransferase [Lentilactobacillus sp. SPB1-3]|uniref:Anthranilate phosphoribosyltransferase n=1 Tax=Lentilactobacillus terminaliae TaxID=3003483 RepID=A0ACD5DH09_9LACO|nr:anthranilate phosphoribosyltransferase [Lentilactobacillus sp. SPB1-3]MCZ0976257.1 anthranilate phosphoribosyltransferase [Lentilactobacillus sp. SPB1-3]
MIKEAIQKVINHENLTFTESQSVLDEIMTGKTSEIETASILTALASKHETIDEIAGAAQSMRNHALPFPQVDNVLEIVGTGGDHANTFNISTTSAILLAAAGFKVAKHGNRAASSKSGAADVLEALGININQTPDASYNTLLTTNLCFLFAQEYHKSMKYVAPIRKELGIRTIFNILGPLTNPAKPTNQLLGVSDKSLMEPLAQVLPKLGVKHALVVHGADGLDEVSPTGTTYVIEVTNNKLKGFTVSPTDFGLPIVDKKELIGGTPAENAQITEDIFSGVKGPTREAVIMNAGMAIHTAKPEISIAAGIQLAQETIDSGKAITKLNQLRKLNNKDVVA